MTESKRILIVEDEAIMAMELSDRMRKLGYVVVAVVSSGEEAVEKAIELKPDIILMDIKIKGDIDGIEAARRINEICRIPVFYLTAYSDEGLLLRAKLTEPFVYMVKPFTIREIHANIEVALYRHEIEQKLKESEAAYRSFIESTNDMVQSVNPDGTVELANRAWLDTLGYSEDDLQTLSLWDVISPDCMTQCRELFDRILAGEAISDIETTFITSEGRPVHIEGNAFPYYVNNELVAIQCFFRDVSKRKKAEKALRANQERLRQTINLVPHQIFLRDSDGRFILVNEAVARSYGTNVDELQGKNLRDVHLKVQEVETFLEEDAEVLKTDRGLHIPEQPFTHQDGTVHLLDTRKIPIQLNGEGACVLGVALDITERRRVQEALIVSEERFRNIFEESPIGIDVFDSQGDLIHANKACIGLFGISDIDNLKRFNLFDDPNLSEEIKDKIRRGETVRVEVPFDFEKVKKLKLYQTSKSGIAYHHAVYAPMGFDESQKPTGFIVQMQDITERRRAELAQLESETRYRELFHHLHDGAWIRDMDGYFVDVNERFLEIFGRSRAEVVGHHVLELFSPESEDEARRLMAEVESQGHLLAETQVLRKDGEIRSVELSSGRVEFGGRSVIQGIARDITDRKKAEQALAKHAHNLSERVKELTCLYETSRLIGSGQSVEKVFQKLVGLMQAAWQYPDITCVRAIYRDQAYATANFRETGWMQSADISVSGEKVGVLEVYYLEDKPTIVDGPFYVEERELIDALAESVSSFIERIGAEKALEISEAKYRALAEESLQGISIVQGGRIVYANQAYADVIGHTIEELVAYTPEEIWQTIHPEDAEWLMRAYAGFLDGNIAAPRSEFRIIHKDGIVRWVESYATTIDYKGETALQIAQIDITERKRAEVALQASEARYKGIFDKSPIAISLVSADGSVVEMNGAFENLFGLTGIKDLETYNINRDPHYPEHTISRLGQGESEELEGIYDFDRVKELGLANTTRSGHIFIQSVITPIDPARTGAPTHYLTQIRDITEKKMAEQNLEEALDSAEFFVDLMGHDLTNINQAVSGTLELALFDESLSSHAAEIVNDTLRQMARATRLITNVRKFRNIDERAPVLKPTDLEKALSSAIQAVQEDVPEKKLEVRTSIDSRRFIVNADEHLNDILYSLLHNAAIHHPGEVVDITVTAEVIDDGENLRISVADDGHGVPDTQKEFLFARISKKKEGYWGTGIGLTLTKHIVDHYCGDIWVEDRVKGNHTKGASFVMVLPVHKTKSMA